MSAFVKLDTMQGEYFVHRCPACGKPPELSNCGTDGQVIYCGTKGHEHKFCVDEYPIEASVKEWNERCARYITKMRMIEMAKGFTQAEVSPR